MQKFREIYQKSSKNLENYIHLAVIGKLFLKEIKKFLNANKKLELNYFYVIEKKTT